MPEVIADPNIAPRLYNRTWFRFFEILPGATIWLALIAPFVLAIYAPLWVTIFIICFDVHWLIRALHYGVILIQGYFRLNRHKRTDWKALLEETVAASTDPAYGGKVLDWRKIHHAIIVTTYKEDIGILRASIESILDADFPNDRTHFVLGIEERAGEEAEERAATLYKEYQDKFASFIVSKHPDNIPGEVKAKGANATWAAKILVKEMEAKGITPNEIIVSTADADSRFDRAYFTCLAYHFAVTEDRVRASYQPVAMYFNNIWETPMLSRVMAFGTTFWQLMESIRSYRLITFSTHAMSLQTLKDINFWCTEIVNEDSRQFFRAFFHYDGRFKVIPLFVPIYMDAVQVPSFRKTMKNLYLQQQRWAYGVEHFPYIVMESWHRPKIPWTSRWSLIWRAFDGAFSWATASFFISVVGWLPIVLNARFREQVIASNFPVVTQYLLTLTWVGLLISAFMTINLMPKPLRRNRISMLAMVAQWILTPISAIFFGALPGIDASTRLMLGKYIGFRITEKAAVPTPKPAAEPQAA